MERDSGVPISDANFRQSLFKSLRILTIQTTLKDFFFFPEDQPWRLPQVFCFVLNFTILSVNFIFER